MKKIVIVIIFLALLLVIGYSLSKNKSKPINQIQVPALTATQMAGGDRDIHGCIGSAGYTWCELKNKCLRIFEEDCQSIEGIKTALASKYNKTLDEIYIKISHENPQYAVGSVKFDQNEGSGGAFLAAKISGKWELIYDGNGSIDCNKIKQTYEFPKEMLIGFCD